MTPLRLITILLAALLFLPTLHAEEIDSIPGPDDQGGMIMAMVSIINANDNNNPTTGSISIMLPQVEPPTLLPLSQWNWGNWFASDAAWRTDLSPLVGTGGTPVANAGNAGLFNNQYGFIFKTDANKAKIPQGKSLAIRITSLSSSALRTYNYDDFDNIWDEVLTTPLRPQVLWSGGMWHNYFTLPAGAAPGIYTATYEVFIVNSPFTPGTGYADYSPSALVASRDTNFSPATFTCTWVVPNPFVARISFVNSMPVISIPSTSYKTYQLEGATNPFSSSWFPIGTPKTGVNGVISLSDTNSSDSEKMFYRVVETEIE